MKLEFNLELDDKSLREDIQRIIVHECVDSLIGRSYSDERKKALKEIMNKIDWNKHMPQMTAAIVTRFFEEALGKNK